MKLISILLIFTIIKINSSVTKNVFCYHHQSTNDIYKVEDIDPTLCTHIVYDYYGLNPQNGKFEMMKNNHTWNETSHKEILKKLQRLKTINPNLKILASVGYWDISQKYSQMSKSREKRRVFITSIITYLIRHEFDGLDLAWKWPGKKSGDSLLDSINHALLITELKERFVDNGYLILTALVNPISYYAKIAYDVPKIAKCLDFIILNSFDMNSNLNKTGFGAPIYSNMETATVLTQFKNIKRIIDYWIFQGVPIEKLILGISTYGNYYKLKDPKKSTVNSLTLGPGRPQPWTVFNQFCQKLTNEKNWIIKWDSIQLAQYAIQNQHWIEYESLKSIELKARYINDRNLGGIMINAIKYDDYLGECEYFHTYPILRTINSVFASNVKLPEFEYVMEIDILKTNLWSNYTQIVYHSEKTTFIDD